MYRFKTFRSGDCNGDIQLLEAKVNAWIEADHPRIRLMCQTPLGDEVLLSFAFEIISEVDDQPALSITAVPEVFQDTLEDTPLDPNEPPPVNGELNKER
ncbi:MAG TPA: hypothetical protein VKT82_25815 [Ktedonobacterales bacterium]|nr:hypothetical protein [Ktedonobacterales bacterium]